MIRPDVLGKWRAIVTTLAGILLCLTLAVPAAADFSFLSEYPSVPPDITTTQISVNYTTGAQVGDILSATLEATGKSTTMDVDGVAPPDDYLIYPTFALGPPGGPYSISVDLEIDTVHQTITPTAGTLRIEGYLGDWRDKTDLPQLVPGSGTLLTGSIRRFGFSDTAFEFLFSATGGDLQGEFPNPGIGIYLHPGKDPSGNEISLSFERFLGSFENDGWGTNDTAHATPEPSLATGAISGMLAGLCLGQLTRRRRRSAARRAAESA